MQWVTGTRLLGNQLKQTDTFLLFNLPGCFLLIS